VPTIPDGVAPATKGPVVLVVDDEAIVRNFIRRVLVSVGYEVMTASSGEEAIALLESTSVDLVITDIRMPGMDGRGLGKLISKLALAPPVLYASASDNPPAGSYYLAKPFSAPDLIRAAGSIIAPDPATRPQSRTGSSK
jgi:CheY-like chemotaxis protein